jgi:glycosyltransferase involved in cell wall biosynthesis
VRILALTNLYPSPWLPERAPFNRQQFQALAALHPVRIIAPVAWTDELAARLTRGVRPGADRKVLHDGIAVSYPPYIFTPKTLISLYGHFLRYSVRPSFDRALMEFRPDILFATWAYPDGWAAVKLGHKAGLPVVIKVHGSDVYMLDENPGRKQRTREALYEADQVVAVSQDLAKRVIALGVSSDRVRVIRNGVDAAKFCPASQSEAREQLGLPAQSPIVLFVGNLVPLKGIDLLISAAAWLTDDKINFSCYLIGQGPSKLQLEQQIRELGLERTIHCLGSKSHDELPDWYRAADVVVLPSRSEGLPNVLLEALACGTRFVASDVGGISEIADGDRGKLLPPNDVEALAKAIRDQLAHPGNSRRSENLPRSFADSAVELTTLFAQILAGRNTKVGERSCPSGP